MMFLPPHSDSSFLQSSANIKRNFYFKKRAKEWNRVIEHEHDISELIRSVYQLQSLTALSWKVATLSFELSIHESQEKIYHCYMMVIPS